MPTNKTTKAIQPDTNNDEPDDVVLNGTTYVVRAPQEWTTEECDRAMKFGLGFQSDAGRVHADFKSTEGGDEEVESMRRNAEFLKLAETLVAKGEYREVLELGLWPTDDSKIRLPYNDKNRTAHSNTVRSLTESPSTLLKAVFSALVGFTVA